MNDIFKMAQQAYHALSIAESELKRLYKENAELKSSLPENGWRQCAVGQRTTQYCGMAEQARLEEREAIMNEWYACVQSDLEHGVKSLNERASEKWRKEYPAIAGFADTIQARGEK